MRFFVLQHPKAPVDDALTDFIPAADSKSGDAPRCERCGGVIGMRPKLPPIRVELETWGKRFGDLAIGVGNQVLVSECFKTAFLRSGLTGFSPFIPAQVIEVVARRGKVPSFMPDYFLTRPGRSRAAVDERASGIDYEEKWKCGECRIGHIKRQRRVVLESGTWSGEDVFVPRGLPGRIVTSERFKEFCDRHAMTNCLLIPAEQHHVDHFWWERSANEDAEERERE